MADKQNNLSVEIFLIIKQFLCCSPLGEINLNNKYNLNEQSDILNGTINDNLIKQYPIKYKYQQSFLRKFIENLESFNVDILDELYEIYCQLLIENNDKDLTHYRHFLLSNNDNDKSITKCDRIIIKENINFISEGTTGCSTWQGAELLAEWAIENKNEVNGKRILELGSGLGLTGLTILNECLPKKYIFTDCHPSVLKLLNENIELNINSNRKNIIDVIKVAWESIDNYTEANYLVDLILGADIIYDISTFSSLITAIKKLLILKYSYAVIAIAIRNPLTFSTFITQLDDCGLQFEYLTIPNYRIFLPPKDCNNMKIIKIFN